MKKIGICGHFNNGLEAIGGQTLKTRTISASLEDYYGEDQILKLDTANWRKNKLIFLYKCIKLAVYSENIIILPAHNGVKILMPLFQLLSTLLNKKLHYIVVGAWLASLLEKNKYLIKSAKKIDFIYPQTNTLKSKLENLGITNNLYTMPNFKKIEPVSMKINKEYKKPYNLVMVSRINKKKGIESAIEVVKELNSKKGKVEAVLDIYGPIEDGYRDEFYQLIEEHNDFILYKGVIDSNKTVNIIKDYYLFLFPTKHFTEGFPGSVLDSYLAGVPILASQWESWEDVIIEGKTGYTFKFNSNTAFFDKLEYLLSNEDIVKNMKTNCQTEAQKYSLDNVINILTSNMS